MSQNPLKGNNPQENITSEKEEKFRKIFYNIENLENIYNILKGEEKQLKKETIKKLIQDCEGVEYIEIKDEQKNESIHTPSKFGISTMNKDFSRNTNKNFGSKENNNVVGKSQIYEDINNGDYISFEEFCNIFKNIYESSENPNKIFLEGFCFMDKDK